MIKRIYPPEIVSQRVCTQYPVRGTNKKLTILDIYDYYRESHSPTVSADMVRDRYFPNYSTDYDDTENIFLDDANYCACRAMFFGEWRKSKEAYIFPKKLWSYVIEAEDLKISNQSFQWMLQGDDYNEIFYVDFNGEIPGNKEIHGVFITALTENWLAFLFVFNDGKHAIIGFYVDEKTTFKELTKDIQYIGIEVSEDNFLLCIKCAFQAVLYMNPDNTITDYISPKDRNKKKKSKNSSSKPEVIKHRINNELADPKYVLRQAHWRGDKFMPAIAVRKSVS